MSDPTAPDPVPVPPPAAPGFFTRAEEKILPHFEHAEADAAGFIASAGTDIQDHAGTVYEVAAGIFGVVKLIDPADAPLAAAAEALVPKVLAMVAKATALAQAAQQKAA